MNERKESQAGTTEIIHMLKQAKYYEQEMRQLREDMRRVEGQITVAKNADSRRMFAKFSECAYPGRDPFAPGLDELFVTQRLIEAKAQDARMRRQELEQLIMNLDEPEKSILRLRWLQNRQWTYIAMNVHVSERHCQRIQKAALEKLGSAWAAKRGVTHQPS